MEYYKESVEDVLEELKSSERGLSEEEGRLRLQRYGFNELKEAKKKSKLKIFLRQFRSFLIWILVAAVVISAVIGDYIESLVILFILLVNAIIGFLQEYKAEKAIEALKRLAGLKADVLRGTRKNIDARLLVPGDIIFLKAGDKVPADARLVEVANLETQESSLTGESTPVQKKADVLKRAGLADQTNMVFSGTTVTRGRARAVVVRTGMSTEIGGIAKLLEESADELTPLQVKLDVFAKYIGFATIGISAVVFLLTVLRGEPVLAMFETAVSLAVAAVPEGLPAIVTISLALGVQRMVKRNALVRRLPSVETLGSTTVICSDKTGTLTCDQMTVRKIFVDNQIIEVSGEGYSTEGGFSRKLNDDAKLLLRIGALCSDAELGHKEFRGDPTEAALIVSAEKAGIKKFELERDYPRIDEIPFDSERKLMSTVHKIGSERVTYTKGAVDVILKISSRILANGKIRKLTEGEKKKILQVNEGFAKEALRVLGFAFKPVKKKASEKDLIFVGMQGMIDPARPEVKAAIDDCKRAGIRVVMITGDHKATAEAIAKQLGIRGRAVSGEDLDRIRNLDKHVEDIAVYARVNPAHKIRIVKALKKKGHIVAMTGDGANDAPALKDADIGVAMGITGTDVSKEASDMILTDDNFTSIRNAVEEGRAIYDGIRKFIFFLLSSNLSEVLVILLAILMGLKLPLVAIQILLVNLITDGLPALALGVEPADKGIMRRKPRKKSEHIINKEMLTRLIPVALIISIGTLALFVWALLSRGWSFGQQLSSASPAYLYAITVAFTALVMFEMFNALNAKSEKGSSLPKLFSNKYLLLAIALSIGIQCLVIYSPLSTWFHTTALSLKDWIIILAAASSVLVFDELRKLFIRKVLS
jgi:Ca2+-transporting ATPase